MLIILLYTLFLVFKISSVLDVNPSVKSLKVISNALAIFGLGKS